MNDPKTHKQSEEWVGLGGWVGVGGCGWVWVGVGGCGWVWVGVGGWVGGCGWVWVGVGGCGWVWVGGWVGGWSFLGEEILFNLVAEFHKPAKNIHVRADPKP